MKKVYLKLLGIASCMSLFFACSSGENDIPEPTPPPAPIEKMSIRLSCEVSSRVTDSNYENGDKIGLFVVNNNAGTSGSLQVSGNHVNNVGFTFDGSKWNSGISLYWEDDKTKADFYVYYPYTDVTNVTAHPFSVREDQSSVASYKNSEFLYGTLKNVSPTNNAVNVTTYHSMSCAIVKLVPGDGFDESDLNAADISVIINGLKTASTVNLQTGEVNAVGEVKKIFPLHEDGIYKALVVPQAVSADDFITVVIDGNGYRMGKEDFAFVSGKCHTFTVTVNKTSSGINVNIGAWEEDEIDNGGTAE